VTSHAFLDEILDDDDDDEIVNIVQMKIVLKVMATCNWCFQEPTKLVTVMMEMIL
jgi:hypothetical protein